MPTVTPVTTPPGETVATAGLADDQVTVFAAEPVVTTVGVSGSVAPIAIVAACGATATDVTPADGVTVTVAVPVFVVSNVDVAMIVAVPAATPVTSPLVELTVATAGFPDDHVTVSAATPTAETAAFSCVVCPAITDAVAGTTTTVEIVADGGGGGAVVVSVELQALATSEIANIKGANRIDAREGSVFICSLHCIGTGTCRTVRNINISLFKDRTGR